MGLTAFEERRTLTWGDFLLELDNEIEKLNKYPSKIRNSKERRTEVLYIKQLVRNGEVYQEQMNEPWLDSGYMSYQQYMKQMHRYILAQDDIMDNIKGFIENCHKFYNNKS